MADEDRSLLMQVILDRIDKSDEQTRDAIKELKDDTKAAISALSAQHERDKADAIARAAAKEAKDNANHAENTGRLEIMDRKLTTTFGVASMNDQWINKDGKPAIEWVNETGIPRLGTLWNEREAANVKRTATRNRALGAAAVWGAFAACVGGLATVVGLIGLDGVAALLARLARAMGAQ